MSGDRYLSCGPILVQGLGLRLLRVMGTIGWQRGDAVWRLSVLASSSYGSRLKFEVFFKY